MITPHWAGRVKHSSSGQRSNVRASWTHGPLDLDQGSRSWVSFQGERRPSSQFSVRSSCNKQAILMARAEPWPTSHASLCVYALRSYAPLRIRGRTRGGGRGSTSRLLLARTYTYVPSMARLHAHRRFRLSSQARRGVLTRRVVRRLKYSGLAIACRVLAGSGLRGGLAQPRNAAETRTAACHHDHCSRHEGLEVFRGILKCPPRSLRTGGGESLILFDGSQVNRRAGGGHGTYICIALLLPPRAARFELRRPSFEPFSPWCAHD